MNTPQKFLFLRKKTQMQNNLECSNIKTTPPNIPEKTEKYLFGSTVDWKKNI